MRKAFQRVIFWGGYVLAGLVVASLAVSAHVLRLTVSCERERERKMRRLISLGSGLFVEWLRRGGALEVENRDLIALRNRTGVIFAANHPTFIDALFLFYFLEQVFCVVKPSIRRDFLLAPITGTAGYLAASTPLRLVQESCQRLQRGENLLLFPEGTRSAGKNFQRFKAGFALVAVRSGAPVQTIHIDSNNGGFLRKGSPFFALWQPLPLRYRFRPGREFTPAASESTGEFLARVEGYFRDEAANGSVASLSPGR